VTALKTLEEKLMILCSKKDCQNAYDLALLNIPEQTYNYSEYRDGLISDDFEYNNTHH